MDCMSLPAVTPSQDMTDRVQECQHLLMEIEELSKQKEKHIKRLAVREGTVEERRRMVKVLDDRETDEGKKMVKSMQEKLDEHKDLVMGHLKTIENLQSAYRELILGLLESDDPDWLHFHRKVLIVFHLAKYVGISDHAEM